MGETNPIGAIGAIASEAVRGAGMGWERDRRRQAEQTKHGVRATARPARACWSRARPPSAAALGPYGALPEIARGGVEKATGSPLAGAAAYAVASVLGPGGIKQFLQEGLPVLTRSPATAPRWGRSSPTTPRARCRRGPGVGLIGAPIAGVKTGIDALREGKTPQEALADAT